MADDQQIWKTHKCAFSGHFLSLFYIISISMKPLVYMVEQTEGEGDNQWGAKSALTRIFPGHFLIVLASVEAQILPPETALKA